MNFTESENSLLSYYRSSEEYREKLNRHDAAYYRFYIELLCPARPEEQFLDFGCGTGEAALALGERGYRGMGVDVSPLFVDDARAKAAARGIEGVEFVESEGDVLPFQAATFSVAGSYEVFEHLYHPDRAVAELARILKPGGQLIIAAPNYLSPVNQIGDPLDNSSVVAALKYVLRKLFGKTFYLNIGKIVKKEFFGDERLDFREIGDDSLTGKGGDEDAVFVCNPIDLIRLMELNGLAVKFYSSFGYSPRLNRVVAALVNRIPILRFMGWGTFVLGEKRGSAVLDQE